MYGYGVAALEGGWGACNMYRVMVHVSSDTGEDLYTGGWSAL